MKRIFTLMALLSIASLQADPEKYIYICPETGARVLIHRQNTPKTTRSQAQKMERLTTNLAKNTAHPSAQAIIGNAIQLLKAQKELELLQLYLRTPKAPAPTPEPACPDQPRQAFTAPTAPEPTQGCFCSIL